MHPTLQLLLSTALFMVIHISVMAACAPLLGIAVRSVHYGAGPTLLTVGRARIKLLPFLGNMVLNDTREVAVDDDDPRRGAYNHQPLWKQLVLPLSGVAVLLALSLAILRAPGWTGFTAAFAQILHGALAPLSTAQQLLADGDAFARTHGFALVAALVSVKLCAFNLLPFGGLNGGQALLALARGGKPYVAWEATVAKWLLLPGLAVALAWLVAFGVYGWKMVGA